MIEIDFLKKIARMAGSEIMSIYEDATLKDVVDYKSDHSPLTLADQASHNIIVEALKRAYPPLPIISEEGSVPDYKIRKKYEKYWLIDPLDGTKEFINRNGEFTVNIALIEGNRPIMGLVYAPAIDTLYYGDRDQCTKEVKGGTPTAIVVNNKDSSRTAVRSKSHASPEEEKILNNYNIENSISVGSSLKFCMVAEGKADIYYRHGPTMEWDTAAGQAVLEAAGGKVFLGNTRQPFTYNKENLLNGSFLALGFSDSK